MMTAPRPVSTIEQSLASFREAGFKEQVKIVDEPNISTLQAWRATAYAVMESRTLFVGIMEDDILWARNAAAVLHEEIALMGDIALDAGYLSLYAFNRHVLEPRTKMWRGWHVSHYGFKSAGAQCYIMPRRAMKKLFNNVRFHEFCEAPPSMKRGADHVVSGLFRQMNKKCWFRIPSLVSHRMGIHNSTLGHAFKDCDDLAWQEEATIGGA